jgi:hypothetical protein
MGRQARIKRERRHARSEPSVGTSTGARTVMLTVPMPGAQSDADENGHFDDCEICRALRAGDEAGAAKLARQHAGRVDISQLHDLDLTPFLEWMKAEGIEPDFD